VPSTCSRRSGSVSSLRVLGRPPNTAATRPAATAGSRSRSPQRATVRETMLECRPIRSALASLGLLADPAGEPLLVAVHDPSAHTPPGAPRRLSVTTIYIKINYYNRLGSRTGYVAVTWLGLTCRRPASTIGGMVVTISHGRGGDVKSRVACVRITSPDGQRSTYDLDAHRTMIGRATPDSVPELALGPDPYRLVSRVHCILECSEGTWLVTDNASDNGTMLRRNGEMIRVLGTSVLQHGDTIFVLGDITTDGQPRYWKLKFDDPFRTEPAPQAQALLPPTVDPTPHLVYDWIQMKVYRVEQTDRTEITGLSPQAHKLIRYMADLSRINNGSPVACSHTELIHMMWGRPAEWPKDRIYDETNLRNIVNAARKRIERDPGNPRLLQTERNIGYRLLIRADESVQRSMGAA